MAKTILIVDYEEKGLTELTGFFQGGDYSLLVARDGHQAVELYQAEKPDLVLTSALLPKINGFDLSKMISRGSLGPARPVVIYSNIYKAVKYRREATEVSGAAEFLEKPLDRDQLLLLTERLMAAGKLTDSSPLPLDQSAEAGNGAFMPGNSLKGEEAGRFDPQPIETIPMHPTDILDMEFLEPEKMPAHGRTQANQDEILELTHEGTDAVRRATLEKTEELAPLKVPGNEPKPIVSENPPDVHLAEEPLPDQESLSAVDEILELALEESELRANSSFNTPEESSPLEFSVGKSLYPQESSSSPTTLSEKSASPEKPLAAQSPAFFSEDQFPAPSPVEESVAVLEESASPDEAKELAWNPVTLSAGPKKKPSHVWVIWGGIFVVLTLLALIYFLMQKNPF